MARFNQGDFGGTGLVTGWRSHQGCLVEYRFMMIYDLCVCDKVDQISDRIWKGKHGTHELSFYSFFFKVFFCRCPYRSTLRFQTSPVRSIDIPMLGVKPRGSWDNSPKISEGGSSFRSDVDMIAIKKALIHWIFSWTPRGSFHLSWGWRLIPSTTSGLCVSKRKGGWKCDHFDPGKVAPPHSILR